MGTLATDKGILIAEGKTKKIWKRSDGLVCVESKNDITAGDGAKHDEFEGKGILANTITCNVFQLLKDCGISVAFIEQLNETDFLAECCTQIELEVIVRREAQGSYLKRNPWIEKGEIFPNLIVEFDLKTSGRKWKGTDIPCDDPLMIFEGNIAKLYVPNVPLQSQEPFLVLDDYPLKDDHRRFEEIEQIARETFLILEKALQLEGGRLLDFKIEFGFNSKNQLRLSDVIDCESWRATIDGKHIDKQGFREGEEISETAKKYRQAVALTERFRIPKQQIVLWTGSPDDIVTEFKDALDMYFPGDHVLRVVRQTCSLHKEPMRAIKALTRFTQEIPDTVIIAFVGMSNGAGPTLSAHTSVPVLTVPATTKEFPDDVHSSLRTPSDVPVMTVLSPKNAALAALNILAARNPAIYAKLHLRLEKRLMNVVAIG